MTDDLPTLCFKLSRSIILIKIQLLIMINDYKLKRSLIPIRIITNTET